MEPLRPIAQRTDAEPVAPVILTPLEREQRRREREQRRRRRREATPERPQDGAGGGLDVRA